MKRSTKPRPLGRRSEAEAETTKRGILLTARRLFADRGFEGVGLREIATEAGISHGLLRHHYGSKEAVWQAMVDATESEFVGSLTPYLMPEQGENAVDAAAELVRQFVAVAARNPDPVRLLLHEGVGGGARLASGVKYITSAHRYLAPLVQALHAQGRLEQFDSRALFHFLLFAGAAPFAVPALSHALIDSSVEEHAERLVRTLLG
jgi:TetR/AcrR family transcriptional regulator